MSKVLLWLGVVMMAIYVVKTEFLTSSTWTAFRDGCMRSEQSNEAQCSCLSDYIHKRFSDQEVQRIMDNVSKDERFTQRVNQAVLEGSQSCRAAS